jgi:hypothetical protein
MKKTFMMIVLALLCVLPVAAQTESKCYRFNGLKNGEIIYLKIEGTKVSGEYIIEREFDPDNRESFGFAGTKTGDVLTVKFHDLVPEGLPEKRKSYSWTITSGPMREYLKFTQFGKNYITGKYGKYSAEYDSCEPVYGALAASARRVRFPRGTHGTSLPVRLDSHNKYAAYWLNLRKGERMEIESPGNSIRVYLPDKTLYSRTENLKYGDSGTFGIALDALTIESLPQSGDYLLVLEIAGESDADRTVTIRASMPENLLPKS